MLRELEAATSAPIIDGLSVRALEAGFSTATVARASGLSLQRLRQLRKRRVGQ